MSGLSRFSKVLSFGAASVSGLCGFGARCVAETGKVFGLAQSQTALSVARIGSWCSAPILRDPQLSSCFARSVSLKFRAGFVEFLPRFASLGIRQWCAQGLGLASAGLRGGGVHLGPPWRRRGGNGASRGRAVLGLRKLPGNSDLQGTPQLYLLFAVAGRFENSRRVRWLHGGAPEIGRSAAEGDFWI